MTKRCRTRMTAVVLAIGAGACSGERARQPSTLVTYHSPMWYEETGSYFQPSPDGRRAIYGTGSRSRLYDLAAGKEDDATWRRSLDRVRAAAFMPDGTLVRLAAADNDSAWYGDRNGQPSQLPIPPKALPRWAPDGNSLAYFVFGESTITIAAAGPPKTVHLDGRVNGLAWAPSGQALYAVALHDDGLSALNEISIDGSVKVV